MIEYNYHTEEVPKNMRITQVSGIILNEKKQVLIYQEKNGNYRIPGGHPEKNETLEETLKREVLEEVNIIISDISYLGFQEVNGDTKDSYAQVRMLATIKSIGEERPDPAEHETYQRILIPLKELNNYLNWGSVGDEMTQQALNKIKGVE
ncbi:MAG: NUDIX hydrolase [Bacilli bacterium]|jgi:ADP-ribose pyrophosphatase YjhB (NUDIX family)|nr:NUDIX hydrolase [Bacilli bacterium]